MGTGRLPTRPPRSTSLLPSPKLPAILQALPFLAIKDLQQIKLRVDGLLAVAQSGPDLADEEICYQEYAAGVKRRGGVAIPFWGIAKTTSYRRSGFRDGVKILVAFIDGNLKKMRRPVRAKVLRIVAGCCAGWVDSNKRLSPKRLSPQPMTAFATAMKNVAEAVDASFPDYADCGLLDILAVGIVPCQE